MKIFISHSSKNKKYGDALVDLLISIGIKSQEIIFTSNDAYGIPIGKNIFDWLKKQIKDNPFVIYLLSPDYYNSVACLNEMGAAWVIENNHAMIFTPDFNLNSYEFQNGAIDPREIGFYINNEDRLISFIDSLKKYFAITENIVLINQKTKKFLKEIETYLGISDTVISSIDSFTILKDEKQFNESKNELTIDNTDPKKIGKNNHLNNGSRFHNDLISGNLKDEEILLVKYIIDTNRFKLGTGWQESNEIANIKTWEDINNLNTKLSNGYSGILKRLEIKNLIEVSNVTSYGNPKEMQLIEEFTNELLSPCDELKNKIDEVLNLNSKDSLPF